MDFVHDEASLIGQEDEDDRISNLPDDIIHHILSFLDMKDAIQTSKLSRKWRHIWTSMPYLNLNSLEFRYLYRFAKFVKHVLSRRKINHAKVSALELIYTGTSTVFVEKTILKYAFSHGVRQLNIRWLRHQHPKKFPQSIFSCHTLKHLTLTINDAYHLGVSGTWAVPESAWDLPALETLDLTNIQFLCRDKDKSLDLFSKCVKLKNITLHKFYMTDVKIFNIYAHELSNLTITFVFEFPKVFNVVAPKLQNFTASVNIGIYGPCPYSSSLKLSTDGFKSLEKVNLSFSHRGLFANERFVPVLINLFQKLNNAKFLTLDIKIIEALSKCLDQLSCEPCPFKNLKCLKINMEPWMKCSFKNLKCLKINMEPWMKKDRIATLPTQVRNYFFENSPNATFIMDLPQVPHKRSRQEEHNTPNPMAKKVPKLEEEKNPVTMPEEKMALEAKIQMQDEK